MPDQPASERARVMHLLADARERMLREGVAKEDDEAVDWGNLLAACMLSSSFSIFLLIKFSFLK
ncbi:hypothetical protein [Akkermansia muciniphila]|uniref:hypothetical protein n=1 Tax=Akkermansia muciniphila TaxID=239935 RepID=UPI0011CE637F|nr:hypothetical protein [Akkermansia muciniphila]